ncbi:MAG TPA: hypothetical protein VLL08_03135 [Kineosporiaceae bacterium]|nr:hypothetical protein [Kineosporiaceae bacterium]
MSETTPPAAEQPIDLYLVERLLADRATPGDDDERALAILFTALRSPAVPSELAGREDYLAAFAAAQTLRIAPPQSRRKSMLATLLATKTLVAGCALVTVAGTAAAAYTGSLPAALQDVAHQSVGAPAAHVSPSSSPDSDRPTARPTLSATPKPTAIKGTPGPKPTGAAARGWCNAFDKGGLGPKSKARRALSEAAGGPSHIPAFCALVLHGATGRPHSTDKPGDRPTAKPTNQPGKPAAKPTGKLPGRPTNMPTTFPSAFPTNQP